MLYWVCTHRRRRPPPAGCFLHLSMYRGLVLPRLSHQSANQQSVCVLEKRKQAQRIRGKFQGAPEFATFASPQALRANSTFIQRGAFDASEILNALTYCRKNPGKQRRFSGRVKEVRRENEIPPGPESRPPRFLYLLFRSDCNRSAHFSQEVLHILPCASARCAVRLVPARRRRRRDRTHDGFPPGRRFLRPHQRSC